LKFSGLQDSGTEKFPSLKIAPEIYFHYLKKAFNFEYFFRYNLKLIIILHRTLMKIFFLLFCDIFSRSQEIGNFRYFIFSCSIFNANFKVERMQSGSKFGAWVSFHTII